MSDPSSSQQPDSDPVPLPPTTARPVFKTHTTGSQWGDMKAAVSRLSSDDFAHIGEMPCVRGSLLNGIAAGAGVGLIRGFSARPFVASNWAMGTFMLISIGTWTICQNNRAQEVRKIQRVIEEMPRRYVKKDGEEGEEKEKSTST